jgi:hypothetical protein
MTDLVERVAGLYERGRQPCPEYQPRMEVNPYATWANVHECFGPYDGRPRGCGGRVSFCETCHTDHHSDGWDTCGATFRGSFR